MRCFDFNGGPGTKLGSRCRVLLLLPLVSGLLAACSSGPVSQLGDVVLGEYDVAATRGLDSCDLGEGLQQADFSFRARFSVNEAGSSAYMVVAVPPSYVEQRAIQGTVDKGMLSFAGQNVMTLTSCNCAPMVSEHFVFDLHAESGTDGGVDAGPDGGADAGPRADGGMDAGAVPNDGGTAADAGPAIDAGPLDGGANGFPDPNNLTLLSGGLNYAVGESTGCIPRDADAGTGCTLPCEIAYTLSGNRR